MKRIIGLMMAVLLVFTMMSGWAEATVFTDEESGLSFEEPENWNKLTSGWDDIRIKVMYQPKNGDQAIIQYMVIDFYKDSSAPNVSDRSALDYSKLEDSTVQLLYYPFTPDTIEEKTYGSTKFKMGTLKMQLGDLGNWDIRSAVTMKNGYLHVFQYMEAKYNDSNFAVLEKMLNSVTIK